jgi:hypothetical protein
VNSNGNLLRFFEGSRAKAVRVFTGTSSFFIMAEDSSILEYSLEEAEYITKYPRRTSDKPAFEPYFKLYNGFLYSSVHDGFRISLIIYRAAAAASKTLYLYSSAEQRLLSNSIYLNTTEKIPIDGIINTVSFINRYPNVQKIIW